MQKVGKWQQLKIDVKRNKVSYIMLTPYFVLFFIFTVLPVCCISSNRIYRF